MTRADALSIISKTLPSLDDERVEFVAEMIKSWSEPSVFVRLPVAERAKIDAALDRLDNGQTVAAEAVFDRIAAKLKDAGA